MTVLPGIPLPPSDVMPGLSVSHVPADQGGSEGRAILCPNLQGPFGLESTGVEFQVLNTWLGWFLANQNPRWPQTDQSEQTPAQMLFLHTRTCGLGPML